MNKILPASQLVTILLIFFLISGNTFGQCVTPIASFPYFENFETNNGGWTSGGVASDWAYGLPNKTVITSALSSKCWTTGGLTGNAYNNSELAWVQSPCFNFTNNLYPYVKCRVFWESEKNFDGALLEYSINGGTTWSRAGSANDVVNCLNGNWYNSTVKYLAAQPSAGNDGWSGSITSPTGCPSSSGSGGWVTAQHTLPILAGQPSVIFRFLFGAGTSCNNFNGFAFDDFWVGVAPPNNAGFTYTCTSSNTVSFTNTSILCPTLTWNFGDPASGTANTSVVQAPSHTYAAPGTYIVSLTATGPGNATSAITLPVTILGLSATVTTPITCASNSSGAVTAAATGGPGPFTYSWNTTPVQTTQTAINLPAGNYTVTVNGPNTCPITASVNLTAPASTPAPAVVATVNYCQNAAATQLTATGNNLLWYSVATGGTGSATAPISSTTTAGSITFYVSATNGSCESLRSSITVNINPLPMVSAGNDTTITFGSQVQLNGSASGVASPVYLWTSTISPLLLNAASILRPVASPTQTTTYKLTVTDAATLCSASKNVTITVLQNDCINVRNAFTPNGDGINDLWFVYDQSFCFAKDGCRASVYNRYGTLVYESNNYKNTWDGTYKGKPMPDGTYYAVVTFLSLDGLKRIVRKDITILR